MLCYKRVKLFFFSFFLIFLRTPDTAIVATFLLSLKSRRFAYVCVKVCASERAGQGSPDENQFVQKLLLQARHL